ncbi:MAG: TROVE domain-containing protein [Micrococcales bacterium]|nr:TROVE domain-containing protein [Micrococcales bacterium]
MTTDIYGTVQRKPTQMVRTDPRQVVNNAGGYVYSTDDAARLQRFLTLGAPAGTYYVGAAEHLADNVAFLLGLADRDPVAYVEQVVRTSQAGLAPKQQPGLFALAVAASVGNDQARTLALDALPQVARTGSTLLTFARYAKNLRGTGRGLRRALGSWYTARDVDAAALQMVKYRSRDGWTHADVLRLAHPSTADPAFNALFRWVLRGERCESVPRLVDAFEALAAAGTAEEVVAIVADNRAITWEMLPDRWLGTVAVWEALLANGVPLGALVRQLPRLTRIGLLYERSEWVEHVTSRVTDPAGLKAARIHPLSVLSAARTYAEGAGRGGRDWRPVRAVAQALDAGFYAAFGAVRPIGKPVLLALDVSGSMGWRADASGLTPREVSAALALVTANTESDWTIMGYSHRLVDVPIDPSMSLAQVISKVSAISMGGTNTSLPWTWASAHRRAFGGIVSYTDNETWCGKEHTASAVSTYRKRVDPQTRSVVVALTSTGFTINDPADQLGLDVAGYDASVPTVVSDFVRG